jgi:hypothetical protein
MHLADYERNKVLKTEDIMDKILKYDTNWIQHAGNAKRQTSKTFNRLQTPRI